VVAHIDYTGNPASFDFPPPMLLAMLDRVLFFLLAGFLLPLAAMANEEPLEPRPALRDALAPLVETYCIDCHSGGEAEAGFSFDEMVESAEVNRHRKAWKKVLKLLRMGKMPPEEVDAPSDDERTTAMEWLETELKHFDCEGPQKPGHVTLRRLNRTEYSNTISDLMGVDFDPRETFPRDTLGYGFDNIGEVLSLSPLLVEKYLNAAEKIAAMAIVAPESIVEPKQTLDIDQLEGGKTYRQNHRTLTNEGRIWTSVTFSSPGEYLIRWRASASRAGNEPARMRMDFNGQELRTVRVEAEAKDPQTYFARFRTEATTDKVSVSFVNDFYDPDNVDESLRDRNLHIHALEVVGPLEAKLLPASHQLILPRTPSIDAWRDATAWREEATELVRRFLGRAYRRPATTDEIERAVQLLERARLAGDSFERAMQLIVQMTLVSPHFLFRGETGLFRGEPRPESADRTYPLDDYQLATRLSYFLWSSMPDDELRREAAMGTLRKNLDRQLDRMLASERADQFVTNFGQQWLEIRQLETLKPNAELFPYFDESLAKAMSKETFLLLRDVLRSELPIVMLLSADYSFLNERLASHYGIEGVEGKDFRRVQLPEIRQAGLLAHGSVLAVTSHPDRTSPVLRGKWIMQHLLNDAPPPPPAAIDLSEDPQLAMGKSLRERLEVHRANPSCSVCHEVMDQLGFALENFDPMGKWREHDGQFPVDSSGRLPDGREFSGPTGLRNVLVADLDVFRKCLTEKVLTYALGRGLQYFDQCAVEQIAAAARQQGDTLSGIVRAVIHSDPFLRGER